MHCGNVNEYDKGTSLEIYHVIPAFYISSHCAVSQDKKCFEIPVSPMILQNSKGHASLRLFDNKHGNTFK